MFAFSYPVSLKQIRMCTCIRKKQNKLIFLSYRIGTMQAQVFRQFLNSALREHLKKKEVEKCSKLTWHFRNNQDFWMN